MRRPAIAFLFPGSGSQHLGMGRDLDAEFPSIRGYLDGLAQELGYDLRRTMFEGPEEALFHPIASPTPSLFMEAISALSLSVAALLAQRGVVPDAAAGRSMGEYTALAAAGAVSRRDACRLLRAFADQAQKDWTRRPGRVLTVFGLDARRGRELAREVSRRAGVCQVVCAYSHRRMVVVGGEPGAVAEFEGLARAAGATRFAPSREEGAIHTALTVGLARRMRRELKAVAVRRPDYPIWCNYDALPTDSPAVLRRLPADQLDHPVLWEETILGMLEAGVRVFVELPPGRMLTDFLIPLPEDAEVLTADTPRRLRAALERLAALGAVS